LFSTLENGFEQQIEVVTFEKVALKMAADGSTETLISVSQNKGDLSISKSIL
jgi:hypothetical protein